jgi:hypothetical protein
MNNKQKEDSSKIDLVFWMEVSDIPEIDPIVWDKCLPSTNYIVTGTRRENIDFSIISKQS